MSTLPGISSTFLTKPRWSHASARMWLAAAILILVGLTAVEAFWPEKGSSIDTGLLPDTASHRDTRSTNDNTDRWLRVTQQRRLFKPAIPLPSRSMARQSVDRIRGLLSLHGVMQQDGEMVAYIKIKGSGLKSFRVGDSVEDMFRVTRIDKDTVELEIVGERINLEM